MKPPPDPDFEARLRASLDAHARQAPPGEPLAEQIIGIASTEERTVFALPRRSWGRFTLPAAAAVLAAIVGISVAFAAWDPGSDRRQAAQTTTPPTAAPTPTVTTPTATGQPTSTGPTQPQSTTSTPIDTSSLHQVHVVDLTFTNTDDGWALASSQCIRQPGRRCTAMMHTTNGTDWPSTPSPPVNVVGVDGCAAPCATHLRFATDKIGYVYGPDVLSMTTDGGQHWYEQKGLGADALETLNGTVLLVQGGKVRYAKIGSSSWAIAALPGAVPQSGRVTLSRAGDLAVLQIGSALFRSADDGRTWRRVEDPCPSIGAGYTDQALTSALAADGSTVVIACGVTATGNIAAGMTVTSTNGGKNFATPSAGGKLGPAQLLAVADARTQLVVAPGPNGAATGLYRSIDAGNTWRLVAGLPGDLTFLGFESDQVGRAVGNGGRTIWTTRDAGRTWSRVDLL